MAPLPGPVPGLRGTLAALALSRSIRLHPKGCTARLSSVAGSPGGDQEPSPAQAPAGASGRPRRFAVSMPWPGDSPSSLTRRVQALLSRGAHLAALRALLRPVPGLPWPATRRAPPSLADAYDAALESAASRRDAPGARTLTARMWALGIPVRPGAHRATLSALASGSTPRDALRYLKTVPTRAASTALANVVLDAAAAAGDNGTAAATLDLMARRHLDPDAGTWAARVRLAATAAGSGGVPGVAAIADEAQCSLPAPQHLWVLAAQAEALASLKSFEGALAVLEELFADHCSALLPVPLETPGDMGLHSVGDASVQKFGTSVDDRATDDSSGLTGEEGPGASASLHASTTTAHGQGSAGRSQHSTQQGTRLYSCPTERLQRLRAACNEVMSAAAGAGDEDAASAVRQLMVSRGLPPDGATYDVTLASLLRRGADAAVFHAAWEEMTTMGVAPTRRGWLMHLATASRAGDGPAALRALGSMHSAGHAPDAAVRAHVFAALGTSGDLDGLRAFFMEQERLGVLTTPREFAGAYAALSAWAKASAGARAGETLSMFGDATADVGDQGRIGGLRSVSKGRSDDSGLDSDIPSQQPGAGNLFRGFWRRRRAASAPSRHPGGMNPQQGQRWSTAASRRRERGLASSLVQQMEEAQAAARVPHSHDSLVSLLTALGRTGQAHRVRGLLAENVQGLGGLAPSTAEQGSSGAGSDKHHKEQQQHSEQQGPEEEPHQQRPEQRRGKTTAKPHLAPTPVLLNATVSACCRSGQLAEAGALVTAFQGAGVLPDVRTYTALIAGCSFAGQRDLARGLLAQMRQRGVVPSVWTWNALVKVECFAAGAEPGLRLVMESMLPAGVRPDTVTWTTILEAAQREVRHDIAQQALEELHALGREDEERKSTVAWQGFYAGDEEDEW